MRTGANDSGDLPVTDGCLIVLTDIMCYINTMFYIRWAHYIKLSMVVNSPKIIQKAFCEAYSPK